MKYSVAAEGQRIFVGRQGEHGARKIAFPLNDFIADFGSGYAVLQVARNGDEKPYPAPVAIEEMDSGLMAVWAPELSDTHIAGAGEAQLLWIVNGNLAKSRHYETMVEKALSVPGEVSAPEQAFGDKVAADAAKAVAAKNAIENMGVDATEGDSVAVEKRVDPDTGAVTLFFTLPSGGPSGPGKRGVTFTPVVERAENGWRVSWTNDGGLENPAPAIIPDGRPGPQGEPGQDGADGKDGATGPVGPQGEPGRDGQPGATGPQGEPGRDGKDGQPGPAGRDGQDGKAPVKGEDYFTPSDVAEIARQAAEQVEVPKALADLTDDAQHRTVTDEEKRKWSKGGSGTDISLGVTNAQVGQIIKVKSIGPDGKPTEWEPVDMPSGDEKWELIKEDTLAESVESYDFGITGKYSKVEIRLIGPAQAQYPGGDWLFAFFGNQSGFIPAMKSRFVQGTNLYMQAEFDPIERKRLIITSVQMNNTFGEGGAQRAPYHAIGDSDVSEITSVKLRGANYLIQGVKLRLIGVKA